jgi:hypothetical protein
MAAPPFDSSGSSGKGTNGAIAAVAAAAAATVVVVDEEGGAAPAVEIGERHPSKPTSHFAEWAQVRALS